MTYLRNKGFTLIEVMIVVTIVGIMVAFAFPNYQTMVRNNCLTTKNNNLIVYFQLARSESIKRQKRVEIVSKSGNGDWSNGWKVQVVGAAASDIIKDVNTTSCTNVTITETSNIDRFVYRSNGFVNQAGQFNICGQPAGKAGRKLSISLVGRPNTDSSLICP